MLRACMCLLNVAMIGSTSRARQRKQMNSRVHMNL